MFTKMNIYTELKDEDWETTPSIIIKCKPSERATFEHDVISLLYDMSESKKFPYKISDNR